MEKTITITDQHSANHPTSKCIIKLSGGSPWYSYVWLNDVCYTIFKGPRTIKIKKVKWRK